MRPVMLLARMLLVAAAYYVAARLGLRYATIGQSISLIWPATGVAIASLVVLGAGMWPAIALGAILANLGTDVPAATAVGIGIGNTLEAVLATWLLRRVAGPRPTLDNPAHVRAFVLAAAPLGALTAAILGVASLWITGTLATSALAGAVAVWWAGDALGALIVAPAILAWASPTPSQPDSRRVIEVAAICIGGALAIEVGVARVADISFLRQVDYQYLLFPLVVWAALRFGARGASLMTLTVAAVATFVTVRGGGPFVGVTQQATVVALSVYLGAVAVTGLVLAAVVRRERASATAALSRSDQRLALALDAARMGSWYWAVDTGVLSWDDHLRQMYGLAPGEDVTRYEEFIARVHPDDRAFVSDTVSRALESGGELDYEFRILVNDRPRVISDQGRVVCDAEGRPVYVTGVCMDVTERRHAEDQLRQAHRMESIGRLAGGVAHEANNQMSVVLGAADFLLRRSDLHEEARADVEQIRKAAERTATVTAQLLAFSRRQVLRPQVVSLNRVVSDWEAVLRRLMGEDFTVTLQLHPGTGWVMADAGQLEQVLLNLALNARDAMPNGGRLSVETFTTHLDEASARARPGVSIATGRYAALAVSDTGHGMSPGTVAQIFEPFFTTKPVGHGTGLGLSTVYGIVKQSGGYVWAYSEPGQGTTIKVYLPSAVEADAPVAGPAADPAPAHGRVLLVEDNELVRQLTRRALGAAGFAVLEASSGEAALTLLRTSAPPVDIILTDVVMPGMSGRDLAEHARRIRPGVPVIFTSGYTDGEIIRRGLLDPADGYLQKPYTPTSVTQFVQRAIMARAVR